MDLFINSDYVAAAREKKKSFIRISLCPCATITVLGYIQILCVSGFIDFTMNAHSQEHRVNNEQRTDPPVNSVLNDFKLNHS